MNKKDINKTLTAGLWSIESEDQVLNIVKGLKEIDMDWFRGGCWKLRTRPDQFEGLGEDALKMVNTIKDDFGFNFITEVATPKQLETVLKYNIDGIWIGARTTTNPFMMQELAQVLKGIDIPVMVKNPIACDLNLWIGAVERLKKRGISDISLINRGFSVYPKKKYRNEPIWEILREMKRIFPKLPMICDPSHISGSRKYLQYIIEEAIEEGGYFGLMIEVHHNPEIAKTDSKQQITPKNLERMLDSLKFSKCDYQSLKSK